MNKLHLALMLLFVPPAGAAQEYRLGRAASAGEIAQASISVAPDGTGLPDGRGTVVAGRIAYAMHCLACHGAKAEGNAALNAPPLAGGFGTLRSTRPVQTIGSFWPYATTVWDYINRAMPYQAPGTLTPDEVYGVTAYLLHLNGIVTADTVLTRASLPQVQMPNRDGFVKDPRPQRH
jgi:cytochrome c